MEILLDIEAPPLVLQQQEALLQHVAQEHTLVVQQQEERLVLTRTELIEQVEARELHQDIVVLQELIVADQIHLEVVQQGLVAELPYQEHQLIETLAAPLEVILPEEVRVVATRVALEAVVTVLEEAVQAVALTEVQAVAQEVLAVDHHLDLLVHLEAVAAEETKIEFFLN